jgi:hypothetical protein
MDVRGLRAPTLAIAGTIFQDARTPLTLWFRAIWWATSQKNGTSAGLQRVLGLGRYRTAWTWLHKLRGQLTPVRAREAVAPPGAGSSSRTACSATAGLSGLGYRHDRRVVLGARSSPTRSYPRH